MCVLCRWQPRLAMLLWVCTRLYRRRTAGGRWPGSGTTVGKACSVCQWSEMHWIVMHLLCIFTRVSSFLWCQVFGKAIKLIYWFTLNISKILSYVISSTQQIFHLESSKHVLVLLCRNPKCYSINAPVPELFTHLAVLLLLFRRVA